MKILMRSGTSHYGMVSTTTPISNIALQHLTVFQCKIIILLVKILMINSPTDFHR
jgi:hypothetical protein